MVWPSAGRALELLRGARDYPAADDRIDALMMQPAPQARHHKRPAENQSIEGSDSTIRGNIVNPMAYWPIRQQHSPPGTEYDPGRAEYPPSSAVPNAMNPSFNFYPSSNSRWYPTQQQSSPAQPYGGGLSTSVLPQLYSTGLGAERPASSHHHYHDPAGVANQPPEHHSQRYPQYWNDVSTFPQLGSAYAMPGNAMHPQASPTQDDPQIYLSDQFNLYSEPSIIPGNEKGC